MALVTETVTVDDYQAHASYNPFYSSSITCRSGRYDYLYYKGFEVISHVPTSEMDYYYDADSCEYLSVIDGFGYTLALASRFDYYKARGWVEGSTVLGTITYDDGVVEPTSDPDPEPTPDPDPVPTKIQTTCCILVCCEPDKYELV